MVEERNVVDRIADVTIYVILGMLAVLCLAPFVHVMAKSFSSRGAVLSDAVALWPVQFTLQNYRWVLLDKQFAASFAISVARVLLAVTATLAVCTVTAYPLSRDHIHMPGRAAFKVILLVGMLFSGGLIPYYLSIRNLGLINNFLVLILPGSLDIFYTIVLMNFFRGIPRELEEAAVLDGASHLDVLFRVFVPVALPSLATVTLFTAVGHWNSWFDGILFLNRRESWPLQSLMYSVVSTRTITWEAGSEVAFRYREASPEALSAALIVLAAAPILLAYPFLQRYFVTGLTLGSVKE